MDEKNKNQQYAPYERLTSDLRTYTGSQSKDERVFHASGNQKRAGATYTYIRQNRPRQNFIK